jgi:hypothetical protein
MTSLVKECMMDKFCKFFVSKKPRLENAGNANDDKIYVRLTEAEVYNFATVLQRLHITKVRKYLYRNVACCERD